MARPKRLVLVIDPDTENLGVYVFALLVNGFRAIGVNTIQQAREAIECNKIDAAFCMCRLDIDLGVPMATGKNIKEAICNLRIAVIQKRGPKKKAVVATPPASALVVPAHA